MATAPKFQFFIQPDSTVTTTITGLLMGLLAALLPARSAGNLDPATVFRK